MRAHRVEQRALERARLDPDGRRLHHLGAQLAQPRGEAARLSARARDRHHLAVERPPLQPRDRLAQPGHRADERDRRGAHALGLHARGDARQRVDQRALARVGSALHDRHRLLGIAPGRREPLGDQRQVPDAHVEHERAGEAGERVPVERRLGLLGILVAGHERNGRGGVAVRDRNARVGRSRHAGGHAGHDLERHTRRGERLRLLAAAPEHERVAALEAHHALAGPAQFHEQVVGLLLAERGRAGLLAHVAQLGVRPCAVERARRDQAVVEDRVGAGDQLQRAARHQARIAGPGAHEVDDAAHASERYRQPPALSLGEQLGGAAASRRSRDGGPSARGLGGGPSSSSRIQLRAVGQPDEGARARAPPRVVTAWTPIGVWQLASSALTRALARP